MGTTESQLYECFVHVTLNTELMKKMLWIDDSEGKVIYRSKWLSDDELSDSLRAAHNIADMFDHNFVTDFRRKKDVKV